MVNTLHTSNVAEGKIQLQSGQIFNMDVNMPSDRIELFDYRLPVHRSVVVDTCLQHFCAN